MIRVTGAKWVREHVLHLRFSDGAEGDVDLKDELDGPVFAPSGTSKSLRLSAYIQSVTQWFGQMAPISHRSFFTPGSR